MILPASRPWGVDRAKPGGTVHSKGGTAYPLVERPGGITY